MTETIGDNSAAELRSFVERIERLEEEKKGLADDIRDLYQEAKSTGFTPEVLRLVLKIRKEDPDKRKSREALLDVYLQRLGMLD